MRGKGAKGAGGRKVVGWWVRCQPCPAPGHHSRSRLLARVLPHPRSVTYSSPACVCVCALVHMCICVHISTRVCMCACMRVCACVCMHTCVGAHIWGLRAVAGVRGHVGAPCPWCSDDSGCECASECASTSEDHARWGAGSVKWLGDSRVGVSEGKSTRGLAMGTGETQPVLCVCVCARVCVYVRACNGLLQQLAWGCKLGGSMSRCQQLGRLGPQQLLDRLMV